MNGNMWVFPKIGVPQHGWFIMKTPIQMDDLGVALFLKTHMYQTIRKHENNKLEILHYAPPPTTQLASSTRILRKIRISKSILFFSGGKKDNAWMSQEDQEVSKRLVSGL